MEQLTAFTVTSDHARQEQVWEGLARGYNKEPYYIRRLLTEGAVKASDKRAVFVGADAFEAAGGVIARDLFQHDDGGWFADIACSTASRGRSWRPLPPRFVREGSRWSRGGARLSLRPHHGPSPGRSGDRGPERGGSQAACDALRREYDELEAEYEGAEELPDAERERERRL